MSAEQLLFLVLLVAIPLLERLIRAMRARTDGSRGQRRTELPLPASPLPPALPQAKRHAAAEQLRASERQPPVRGERKQVPATRQRTAHSARAMRRGTALRPVIAGGDLRRTIVLMAILGPCRALEPKDASQVS